MSGPALRDAFGRELRYLRLSVTERCNFRCVYCLPQGCEREPAERPLSLDEIGRLLDAFAGLGFEKVRLTGGEPTLRPDLCELVRRAASTPGIRRVGLTTNGLRLAELAAELRRAGLTSLNVSLDSLDPDRFRQVTGSTGFDRVLAGIEAALSAAIPSVKINAVLLRDMDGGELDRFLAWTRHQPVSVRFIELMETADNRELFRDRRLPAAEVRDRLLSLGWSELRREPSDGPAVSYGHPAHTGRVGLISAYAHGFCDTCNRLRVGSSGELRLCLFGDRTVPLRPLLADDSQRAALMARIASAVAEKPAAHQLDEGRCGSVSSLAVIGG